MPASASEVVAVRLRKTFHKYALSAHPSYFAGIPKSTLNALLQVNRRAELIELAVAGYLSFVVSEDLEPIARSRTTREKFLAELAVSIKAERRSFTEAQLTTYAEQFAGKHDFKISPARFVALFFEKRILHIEDGLVHFTLPSMELYLLAKRLVETTEDVVGYFALDVEKFDHRTFTLYAEIGASALVINNIRNKLDESIINLSEHNRGEGTLIENKIIPEALKNRGRLQSLQKQLTKAEDDVRNERDQSHAKQRLLDTSDKIREEAAAKLLQSQKPFNSTDDEKRTLSVDEKAIVVWSVSTGLLGSGAERLEAKTKREIIAKNVKLAKMIVNIVTIAYRKVDFSELKIRLAQVDLTRWIAKSTSEADLREAKSLLELIVYYIELIFIQQPFLTIVGFMCEEARYAVLAESINRAGLVKLDRALSGFSA